MRRFIVRWVCIAAAACSGRAHDAGPTTRPEQGGSARADEAGGPGARPPRALDAALIDALAAVHVANHQVAVVRRGPTDLAAIVSAAGGASVVITASACLGCTPIELPAWESRRAELAALWAPADSSGDRLALTAPMLAGRAVIAIDATRTSDGEARHTYQLHWNDGATQLAAVCEAAAPIGADGGVATAGGPECAAAATAAFAAYLSAL